MTSNLSQGSSAEDIMLPGRLNDNAWSALDALKRLLSREGPCVCEVLLWWENDCFAELRFHGIAAYVKL